MRSQTLRSIAFRQRLALRAIRAFASFWGLGWRPAMPELQFHAITQGLEGCVRLACARSPDSGPWSTPVSRYLPAGARSGSRHSTNTYATSPNDDIPGTTIREYGTGNHIRVLIEVRPRPASFAEAVTRRASVRWPHIMGPPRGHPGDHGGAPRTTRAPGEERAHPGPRGWVRVLRRILPGGAMGQPARFACVRDTRVRSGSGRRI